VAWNSLGVLHEASRLAAEQLPVKWIFDPGTPATLIDYLAGGTQGAVKGALLGLGAELLLAAVFPPAAIGLAFVAGAVAGAVHGVARVHQGWRVRLVYTRAGEPLLEVCRVA
jgi:hypothetical protein